MASAGGLYPLCPTLCPLWGQLWEVMLEILVIRTPAQQGVVGSRLEHIPQAVAVADCRDVLVRWHSRLAYLMMFSSIDKSIIDDTLPWTWQSSVPAPIVSIT